MDSQATVHDVIVIGGGFAGCTAARDLGRAGQQVLLLEARERLGGRTWYRPFVDREQHIEMGGTWVTPKVQPCLREEIAAYGLELKASPEPDLVRWRTGGELRAGFPVPPEDLAAFERFCWQVGSDARRVSFRLPADEQNLADLDVPVTDYVERLAPTPAIRDAAWGWASLNSGAHPRDLSALHFLKWTAGFENSLWNTWAAIADKLAGGTVSLIDALIEESGAEVRLSSPVEAVTQDEDGVTVRTAGGEDHRAARLIVAVPLNCLGDITFAPALSEAKLRTSRERHAGTSVKTWALVSGLDRPVVGAGWTDGSLTWASTEFRSDEGSFLVGFGPSPDAVDITDPGSVQTALRQLVPEAEVIAVDGHDWVSDRYSRGTWCGFRPGQLTRGHGELSRREGRLWFAGGDIAHGWAGWIEGALESGRRAAAEVLELSGADTAVVPA